MEVLLPSKSVGLDGVMSFVMKGSTKILYPFLSSFLSQTYLRIVFLTCGSKQELYMFTKTARVLLMVISGP
jgi:hypothetical protein